MMWWTAALQQLGNVPKRNRDSLITGLILAFAEGQLLAISGRQRPRCITAAVGGKPDVIITKADVGSPMSVLPLFTSAVGG